MANNIDFTSDGSGMASFTSTITELISDKTYFVRAYAVNAIGTGYGQIYQFTTLPCNPIAAEVVEVINPETGRIWMDRNLGAAQAATSSTDAAAFGDLYQWGRSSDGHQCRSSDATTNTLANGPSPGHSNFILSNNGANNDWISPQNDNLWQGNLGNNNPCPEGFRVPTQAEWIEERQSWSSANTIGAFQSPLRLSAPGHRGLDGNILFVGAYGTYWSSTVSGTDGVYLIHSISNAIINSRGRAYGLSVRCIKD